MINSKVLYKKEFGDSFDLGVSIPNEFQDVSYRNDVGASFSMRVGVCELRIWVMPEKQESRDIPCPRYALINSVDGEQSFTFETECPTVFQDVITNKKIINAILK